MESTVTPGELKIIEANVRGLGSKEQYIKQFLLRKKKKADIFCIVEHKTKDNNKLLEQFSTGIYRVVASYCRPTMGGGVALLVHDKLKCVRDAEDRFCGEFNAARKKGVEIAGVELKLKAKGCKNNLFVFGIYRRSSCSQLTDFRNVIYELLQKVGNTYNSSAVFTGDFNFNNNRDAQTSRDNRSHEVVLTFKSLGYKLTHQRSSHTLGSCLNNFLVPLQLKYTPKTIVEGFKIPTLQKQNNKNIMKTRKKSAKEPDHLPIQVVITLKSHGMQLFQGNSQNDQAQGSIVYDIYAPSTSGTSKKPNAPDDVIIISDSDEESPCLPRGTNSHFREERPFASSSYCRQSEVDLVNAPSGLFPVNNGVTLTRVKIEGETQNSRGNSHPLIRNSGKNTDEVVSNLIPPSAIHTNQSETIPVQRLPTHSGTNNGSTNSNQSTAYDQSLPTFGESRSFQNIAPSSSTSNQYSLNVNASTGLNALASAGLNPLSPPVTSEVVESVSLNSRTCHEVITSRSYQSHNLQVPAACLPEQNSRTAQEPASILKRLEELNRKERKLRILAELEDVMLEKAQLHEQLDKI